MTSYFAYQPTSLDEVVLPPSLRQSLKEMQQRGVVESMLFYGKPGTGKSITASLLAKNQVFLRCDGRHSPSEIISIARGAGITTNMFDDSVRKIIVLDEVDALAKNMQGKLRSVIDECAHNATFIATSNYKDDLLPALLSRLRPVCFDPDSNSMTIRSKWEDRLRSIHLRHFNFEISDDLLKAAMNSFPDGRQMISTVTCRSLT